MINTWLHNSRGQTARVSVCLLVLLIASTAFADDWPQWGGNAQRNMVAPAGSKAPATFKGGDYKQGSEDIDLATTENVKWVVKLGSQTFGNPTIAGGRIYVGTNNDMPHDPKYKGDRSILACLDEQTGEQIWQFNLHKLGAGKVGDWEYLGICSSPAVDVERGRVYVVTNLCEIICLDIEGQANGNDGVTDEGQYLAGPGNDPYTIGAKDADVIWRFNMTDELGIFPHNITSSSPLLVGDTVYVTTSNGVDWSHSNIANPRAPALVAVHADTGELLAEEASGIGTRIMHCSWSSPAYADGVVVYGAGDGFCYGFDPNPVKDDEGFMVFKELWRFDCNDKNFRFDENGEPRRYASPPGPSELIGTPVIHDGKVYVAIGQDPEHGEGVGRVTCADLKTGKVLWTYDHIERSISTASVHDGLVYIADYSGHVHCIDAATGEGQWIHDTQGHIWASTYVVDGKVFIGNEDGYITVLATGREKNLLSEVELTTPAYGTAVYANGVLYIPTQTHLYAVQGK